jgi:hypothetical protein
MSKRRTRKQKIKARGRHKTIFNTPNIGVQNDPGMPVKGYFVKANFEPKKEDVSKVSPALTEEYSTLKLIKKDLFKSIIVSSLILCLIVVLYLVWYK